MYGRFAGTKTDRNNGVAVLTRCQMAVRRGSSVLLYFRSCSLLLSLFFKKIGFSMLPPGVQHAGSPEFSFSF